MNFGQRLTRYLLGVAIGCAVVYMIFPDYDWLAWTPGRQVMKRIRESHLIIPEKSACELDCRGLSLQDFQQARDQGKVDFGQSQTNEAIKKYHLALGTQSYEVWLQDTIMTLARVHGVSSCQCP